MTPEWPELPLDAWRDTRDTLHLWTQVAGKIRLKLAPPEPDWAHVTLYVTATGLTTSPIPCSGNRVFQIDFDLVDHALHIVVSDGSRRVLPLVPKTVKAFHAEVMDAVRSLGIECEIWPKPQEIPGAIVFTEDEVHRSYDAAWANRFFEVLYRTDAVMKEYRGRFVGRTTPVHFFWGTFDLAVTRYLGDSMVACGFDGIETATPWWNDDLGEFILPYEDVRTAPSPRDALLDFFERTYEAGAERVSPTGQATPVPPSPQ